MLNTITRPVRGLFLIAALALATPPPAAAVDAPVAAKNKLEFQDKQGNRFQIGGRLQADYSFVNEDGDYTAKDRNEFAGARLYLSGTVAEVFDFKFQYDFEDLDDDGQGIEDAYIRYTGFATVAVTIGQRKAPYSLSELTSSKHIAFIDRSFVSALFNEPNLGVGNRNPGVTFTAKPVKNGIVEAGLYTLRQQDSDGDESIDAREIADGYGFSARAVYAPILDRKARRLLSIGVSGGYRTYPDGAQDGIGNLDADGNNPVGTDIVDSTATVYADDYLSFNVNIAAQHRRLWLSGEYFHGALDLAAKQRGNDGARGLGDDSLSGYYIQGGAFLSDDSRGYKNGVWGQVKVGAPVNQGGLGALEVAFRYDAAELQASLADNGRKQEPSAFSAALNWYPIANIRLQANYVTLFCGDAGDCDFIGKPSVFVLRTQIFF